MPLHSADLSLSLVFVQVPNIRAQLINEHSEYWARRPREERRTVNPYLCYNFSMSLILGINKAKSKINLESYNDYLLFYPTSKTVN